MGVTESIKLLEFLKEHDLLISSVIGILILIVLILITKLYIKPMHDNSITSVSNEKVINNMGLEIIEKNKKGHEEIMKKFDKIHEHNIRMEERTSGNRRLR